MDVFVDLYKKTVDMSSKPTKEQKDQAHEELRSKHEPTDVVWYPIYADRPDSYQADLMFEPVSNSKGETLSQAILCVININTKYAFAEPVDYTRDVKKLENRSWNDKRKRIPVNNKTTELVLRSFKRILQNIKSEAAVLNDFDEFGGHVKFHIARLYTDEGGEFKGSFKKFLDDQGIEKHVFKKEEGSKRRMGVVERFNRTLRRYVEVQRELQGDLPLADLIPDCLDLYNRYENHRGLSDFFRRELEKGTSWYKKNADPTKPKDKLRYFPAMMLIPGMEQDFVDYMRNKTRAVDAHYKDEIQHLRPGTRVRYFKRNEDKIFTKERKINMSKPVEIKQKHQYEYNGDKRTRVGPIKVKGVGASYEIKGTVGRY